MPCPCRKAATSGQNRADYRGNARWRKRCRGSLLRRRGDELDAVVEREGVLLAALAAGLARAHHGKERLRQQMAGDILRLAMALDQGDILEVAFRAGLRRQILLQGVPAERRHGRHHQREHGQCPDQTHLSPPFWARETLGARTLRGVGEAINPPNGGCTVALANRAWTRKSF